MQLSEYPMCTHQYMCAYININTIRRGSCIGVDNINGYTVIVQFFAWYIYVHRELARNGLVLILGYVVHMGLSFRMVSLVQANDSY